MELLTVANTSDSHHFVVMIPKQISLPKMYLLSKRLFVLMFGSKNKNVRVLILQAIMPYKNSGLATQDYEKHSFRPEWHEKYGWLYHDVLH